MPLNPRKEKSLFNGSTKSTLIRNNRAVNELPTIQTRYFRRLVKRKGVDSVVELLGKFTQSNTK